MMDILVIGGTGMLGEPVVRSLHAKGSCVHVMTRSPESARSRFPNSVDVIQGDVTQLDSLETAIRDCQGVHINLSSTTDPELEGPGVQNIVRAAIKAKVQRISYLSGASVCAENCWFAGTRAKFQAETAIRESGVPYSIFRATWFMESLRAFIRESGARTRALEIGRHPYPYHWVAAEDYACMVANAHAREEAAKKIFYVYGPTAYTMSQALSIFYRIAHPDASLMFLPLWMVTIMAHLGRRQELIAALPFFRYLQQVREPGDADEANRLLGAPTTTLEQWSQAEARQ